MDLEERENYRAYCLAGGDPKKFKWASPDHAGSKPETGSVMSDLAPLLGKLKGSTKPNRERFAEYGKIRGLQVVYKTPEGTFVDQDGNPMTLPPGMVWTEAGGA